MGRNKNRTKRVNKTHRNRSQSIASEVNQDRRSESLFVESPVAVCSNSDPNLQQGLIVNNESWPHQDLDLLPLQQNKIYQDISLPMACEVNEAQHSINDTNRAESFAAMGSIYEPWKFGDFDLLSPQQDVIRQDISLQIMSEADQEQHLKHTTPSLAESAAIESTTDSIPAPLCSSNIMGALENIGNSCYMNAVLYVMRFTPSFTHNLHHVASNLRILQNKTDIPTENQSQSQCVRMNATLTMQENQKAVPIINLGIDDEAEVIVKLHNVFQKLTALEIHNSSKTLRAHNLQAATGRAFRRGCQQDSHEYLMYLLDCLRDCSDELIKHISKSPEMFAG